MTMTLCLIIQLHNISLHDFLVMVSALNLLIFKKSIYFHQDNHTMYFYHISIRFEAAQSKQNRHRRKGSEHKLQRTQRGSFTAVDESPDLTGDDHSWTRQDVTRQRKQSHPTPTGFLLFAQHETTVVFE